MRRILLAALIICSACSTPAVLVRKDVSIKRLGISFQAERTAIPSLAVNFEQSVNDFIAEYNSRPKRKFELYKASPTDSATLTIKLVATQLVSEGQQATGVLVSLAGFTLPIVMASAGAPIVLFFYYFPKVKSATELSLSKDIGDPARLKNDFVLASPGFLKSPDKQIEKHVIYFDKLLDNLVLQIEKQSIRK